MLVLTVKRGQKIVCDDGSVIRVLRISHDRVKFGIETADGKRVQWVKVNESALTKPDMPE